MADADNYIELVKQARLGDEESLNRLTELARRRLRVYVYRLTLHEDAADDIVQESILEMFKVLGKLKEADRFWPWLYGIALNKTRRHERTQRRHKTVASQREYRTARQDGQEGLKSLVGEELRQIVSAAMHQLKTEHRAVLTMRCYDDMSYSEIAESLGRSEFATRMLFLRAKRVLERQLSRRGLGKSSLLTALVLFGKMTAPSEAAAANVSVTSATVKVGAAAGLAGIVSSKTAVVSLTAAGVLAVGTMVATTGPDKSMAGSGQTRLTNIEAVRPKTRAKKPIEEYWYYYPTAKTEAVMMRLVKSDVGGRRSYCQWLQNEQANYYFDKRKSTIYIRNARTWAKDLSVWRLPTDTGKLKEFLDRVQGRPQESECIKRAGDGLLVIAKTGAAENNGPKITYHYNVLDEEYFRYGWPAGARVVDNRDPMHRRGWTYFTVTGEINAQPVEGHGRIPFVYAAARRYWPWLRLKLGQREIRECSFAGLARPWLGLHTIDTIRRDAAAEGIGFETKLLTRAAKGQVILNKETGRITYTIDMKNDVIEKITFHGGSQGFLRFNYLADIDDVGSGFAEPRMTRRKGTKGFSIFDLSK